MKNVIIIDKDFAITREGESEILEKGTIVAELSDSKLNFEELDLAQRGGRLKIVQNGKPEKAKEAAKEPAKDDKKPGKGK